MLASSYTGQMDDERFWKVIEQAANLDPDARSATDIGASIGASIVSTCRAMLAEHRESLLGWNVTALLSIADRVAATDEADRAEQRVTAEDEIEDILARAPRVGAVVLEALLSAATRRDSQPDPIMIPMSLRVPEDLDDSFKPAYVNATIVYRQVAQSGVAGVLWRDLLRNLDASARQSVMHKLKRSNAIRIENVEDPNGYQDHLLRLYLADTSTSTHV